ncbi:hypothetical protein BY458DRAFT_544270 [Sporodiniella umbellata]|nr:hypothetical protein BY458DRAFT_544270 [Sporodiniella umbellata]
MFRHCVKRSIATTKQPVDKHELPIKPTWSTQSLLEPLGETISDEQFKHLLNLSRLNIPLEEASHLKKEIDQLTQFTEHIKKQDFGHVEPLTHIWKENTGILLRSDEQIEEDRANGRKLLSKATKKSGNFYVVKGSMPSSE